MMRDITAACALGLLCACTARPSESQTLQERMAAFERPRLETELTKTKDLPMHETASGLRYQVVRAGDGEHPAADSFVALDYRVLSRGDGTSGMSTHVRGFPDAERLDDLPPAIAEAVGMMSAGAEYRFFWPAQAVTKKQPLDVGLDSATIADVELLMVLPPAEPSPATRHIGSIDAAYLQKASLLLSSHVIYPSASLGMNEEGACLVKVVFAGDGRLLEIILAQKTGFYRLDSACRGAVYESRRFPPVPGQPPEARFEVTIPINYRLDPATSALPAK